MPDEPARGDLTVICVLGLGGSAAQWERVRPSLAGRGEVAVVAAPAGVQGDPLEAGRRLLVAEMCRAGRQRTIVVGHSMGAAVALFAAATEPDRVARLVLTAPFLPLARNGR